LFLAAGAEVGRPIGIVRSPKSEVRGPRKTLLAKIERFEEIEAWKEARLLTKTVYDLSKGRGFFRDFALRDQIRRAVVSIMANIAEGLSAAAIKSSSNSCRSQKGRARRFAPLSMSRWIKPT